MKKSWRRICSLILSVSMVFTTLPVMVLGEGEGSTQLDESASTLDVSLLSDTAIGDASQNWEYDGSGILTIYGGDSGTITLTGANGNLKQIKGENDVNLLFDSYADITVNGWGFYR